MGSSQGPVRRAAGRPRNSIDPRHCPAGALGAHGRKWSCWPTSCGPGVSASSEDPHPFPACGWRSCAATSPHTTHELSPPKKIEYRHHPFSGTEVKIIRAQRRFIDEIDSVQLPEGFQIAVPRWMLDPVACSQLPQEAKPRVAVGALLRLADLLQSHDLPQTQSAACLDTSPLTKGKHVSSRPELNLSTSPTAASQEDALGEASRISTKPLPASVAPDTTARRAQRSAGKELR
jgi:hypothetical protein